MPSFELSPKRVGNCKHSPVKPGRKVRTRHPKEPGTMKSSLLHFGYTSVAPSGQVDYRLLVHSALDKFDFLRLKYPKSAPQQVLGWMSRKFPRFFVNKGPQEGSALGVAVGDYFSFRAELCLIGLHRRPQAGIDWIEVEKDDGNLTTKALSIVVSGAYEDNEDSGDILVYTGEGGNDLTRSRKQHEDQKLMKGTEALYNSNFLKNPIRVIRARNDIRSPSGRFLSYDGLYKVVDQKCQKGKSGFEVYKFTLVREPGQKPLIWPPPPFGYHLNRGVAVRDLHEEPRERGQSSECEGLKAFLGPGVRQKSTVLSLGKGGEKGDIPSSRGGGEKVVDGDREGMVMNTSGATAKPVTSLGREIQQRKGISEKGVDNSGDAKEPVVGLKRSNEDWEQYEDEDQPLVIKRVKPFNYRTKGEPLKSQVDNLEKKQFGVPNKGENLCMGKQKVLKDADHKDGYDGTRKFCNAKKYRASLMEGDATRTCNEDVVAKKSSEDEKGSSKREKYHIVLESESDNDNLSDGDESYKSESDSMFHGDESDGSESDDNISHGDESDGSESDDNISHGDESGKEYEVERILSKRQSLMRKPPVEEYLVLWKGYSQNEATWEPKYNLEHCKEALAAFDKRTRMCS